jgi:hypothetical protein
MRQQGAAAMSDETHEMEQAYGHQGWLVLIAVLTYAMLCGLALMM